MNIPGAQQAQRTADAGLSPRDGVHYHTGDDEANETISITLDQRSNILTTDDTYTLTCTLPPVAQAGGMMFFFYLVSDGGQDVTITDAGDDADFDDATMADVNDRCILISDGIHWFCLDGGITTIS